MVGTLINADNVEYNVRSVGDSTGKVGKTFNEFYTPCVQTLDYTSAKRTEREAGVVCHGNVRSANSWVGRRVWQPDKTANKKHLIALTCMPACASLRSLAWGRKAGWE